MAEKKKETVRVDVKELDLPETIFSRDIDNKVLQGIVVKSLSQISGIGMVEGSLFDSILGRMDRVKGIYIEQEPKTLAVKVRVEVSILYGVSIPEKSEEIQLAITKDITKTTGLRVSEVHVVFKELMQDRGSEKNPYKNQDSKTSDFGIKDSQESRRQSGQILPDSIHPEEFSEDF